MPLGDALGILLGENDGLLDGSELGMPLGATLGMLLGSSDGPLDGASDGLLVGAGVVGA